MHKVTPVLVRLNRANILVFGSILFLPARTTRPWLPLLGIISLVPPLSFTLFLSVEVLGLLLSRSYEYWFVSVLNVINWIGIAHVFGDFRALVCVSFWLNSQNVISIDGNYRTYQTTVKSIVMAGPSMLALVFCCSYRIIVDAAPSPSFMIGSVELQWRQIVIFTASTLIIFMFKKAYAKVHRRGKHVISCVVLRARVCLVPTATKQRLRLANIVRNQPATASNKQQLRLARHRSVVIDARRVFLPERYLERLGAASIKTALYATAVTSLTSTAAAWVLLLHNAKRHVLVSSAVAFVTSLLFVSTTAALAQRDLVRLLVWNFDVLFSAFQATALALCLLDLFCWRAAASCAVMAWWLWFVWLLLLDALTPSVTSKLHLRKLALPVIILVLCIALSCAMEIVSSHDSIFTSRLFFSISLPNLGTYEEHTGALAVQRVMTIIGWNARLLFELAVGDPNQLLFICRRIEYVSPFHTFSEPLPTEQQPKRAHLWQRKLLYCSPLL
ncbi:hypothetical protein PHYSODRAFT_516429 [Phytophthora sojae]|uniref:Uncharacterized protein n=1 Tax=Phytophthora sojae (strain P6497) TaxID=1094619 RepID=G4ZY84_PHYSP|nr:hypothetical protein PHYSODRAFT_516429 [Phytophthora sojae]EGZ12696.1 hypothetical protein PHYSODRAFT_516429 [Phytophthora sojae]|eukprot:XP_009533029.1 hypothetical protein PHYSODRAFT_516429 [Phytophthora sojae]